MALRRVVWLLLLAHCSFSQNCSDPYKVLYDIYNSKDYDRNQPPPNYPVDVDLALVIHNIRGINEIDGSVSIYVDIHVSWTDLRLQHPCIATDILGGIPLNKWSYNSLWDPSINIASAMRIEMSHTPLVQVKSSGLVRSIHPYSVVISCFTSFQPFPFDELRCDLGITSWTAPMFVKIRWANPEKPAEILSRYMKLAEFTAHGQVATPRADMGEGTFVEYHVQLRRLVGYYVLQVYVPSVLTVAVATLSFMLSPDVIATRISLCISTLIALVLQHGRIVANLPKVGYIKGIDVWMLACSIFVFAAIAQSVGLAFLKRCLPADQKPERQQLMLKIIDLTSLVLFPLVFAAFVIGYVLDWCGL